MQCSSCKIGKAVWKVEQLQNWKRVINPNYLYYCDSCMTILNGVEKEMAKMGITQKGTVEKIS
jgi:hypothetical protein